MLDQIVRPFLSPLALATGRVVIPQGTVSTSPGHLTWGDAGTLPSPQQEQQPAINSVPVGFKIVACKEKYNERKRQSSKVQVTNPDDPTQYVMVDRINSISFDKTSSQDVLNNPDLTGTFTDAFADFGSEVAGAFPQIEDQGGSGCDTLMSLHYSQ